MSDRPSDPSAGASVGAGSLSQAVWRAGDRIQEIIDAAERVAAEIRADAEAEAASYLRERRREIDGLIGERVRDLLELTESLSARAEHLRSELTATVERIDTAESAVRPAQAADIDRDPASPQPASAGPEQPGEAERIPEVAVLRATQMIVSGTKRTEIERTLQDEFGIENPAPVVDEMLRVKGA